MHRLTEIMVRYRLALGDREGRFSYWYRNGEYQSALTRNEALGRVEKFVAPEAARA